MTTGTVIVQDALCQRGILADNVAPTTDQLAVGLRFLNRMLDSWGNEAEMIYVITSETFTTTPSVATYSTTSFSSGNGRPVGVDSITMVLSGVTYSVDLIDNQTYNSITFKAVDAIPTQCYYDANFPNANFNFYPRPFAAFTVNVDCYQKLSGTVGASTDLVLPAGYEKAIVDNLAVYMNYGNPPTRQMIIDANESRNVLKRRNFAPKEMNTRIQNGADFCNGFLYKGF